MQKIWILLILVISSLLAKSQDSTDYTLNNIKRYATHVQESLSIISSNIEADKQQAVVQQADTIKVSIDSMAEEMEYLPDEYYYRLSSLVSSYHTDIDEFKKLVVNKEFQGKDKLLAKALTSLQQRQTEFYKALDAAYYTATKQQLPAENNSVSEVVEEGTKPGTEPQSAATDTTAVNTSNVVLVEAVDPHQITTTNNALLLDTIHGAQQQIQYRIDNIHLAITKDNFGKLGVYANGISNASLKIRDLTLLLKTDQKESLYILATGLKNLADTFRELTRKGSAAHDDILECIEEIETKFNTLSTGISLVQQ